MTSGNVIPTAVLKRKAVVYVRQSTQAQVQLNLESQRRQYELVDVARRWGFRKVEVIDEDLGRTASGAVERPGFERLVDDLCTGQVGAVLCLEASRLSRNGPDWHRLLELCGEVDARVIDLDGIYDPGLPNDRLLLGMKGSISEFELGVLRARMYEAARAKAQRGELRISVPFGYVWHRDYGLGFDPDMRLQETIRLIFARFRELGSARQVLISMIDDGVHFPRPSDGKKMVSFDWVPIRYRNVISILKNPFYAGAYVYGKSEKRTEIVDGAFARAMAITSRLASGRRWCSTTITKATSDGASTNGTRNCSRPTLMAKPAASSRAAAVARCSRVSSPVVDAGEDWLSCMPDAAKVIRYIAASAATS
jgi:DNA invertase Pin-like site-specific DNA recombinase